MKREKQFCAVWMNKWTNMNEVSKKKKVCKDTRKKITKENQEKKEWLWDIFERQTKPV